MNSNLKNFTLEDIEIDDEAMEDLETFNEKYYNKLVNNVEETKEEKTINDLYIEPSSLIQENAKIFSVKRYLQRILNSKKYNKQNLIDIAWELAQLGKGNLELLGLIKSVKKNLKKEAIITLIISIIFLLLKN